jgi:hypothetical protein
MNRASAAGSPADAFVDLALLAGIEPEASLDCCAATPQMPNAAVNVAANNMLDSRDILRLLTRLYFDLRFGCQ